MATKIISISTDDPIEHIVTLYAGENLTEMETESLLTDANLDEVVRDVQSVPRLFSQGSFIISSRIDSRDINLTANIVNIGNSVINLRAQLNDLPYGQKIKVVYEDAGYFQTFNDCRFVGWTFRKVGASNEYEVTLSLRSFDGK